MPRPGLLLALAPAVALAAASPGDWLLQPRGSAAPSTLQPWRSGSLSGLALSNGLVSRLFVLNASGAAVFATWDVVTMLDAAAPGGDGGESLLRGLSPEATLLCAGCAAPRGAQPGPGEQFVLVANNSAVTSGDCANVGQGDDSSLAACEAACWAQGQCNAVNYGFSPAGAGAVVAPPRRGADGFVSRAARSAAATATAAAPPPARGTDCVLRACANAMAPQLSPYPGFAVYATPAVAATNATRLGGLVAGPSVGRDLSSGAFLNRTGLDAPGALVADPAAAVFTFVSAVSGPTQARFDWTPGSRGADPSIPWPPPGLRLTATFSGSGAWAGVTARVIYEIFDGIPLIGKWVELDGDATAAVTLDAVTVEDLALNPPFSPIASAAYAGQAEDFPGGVPLFPGAGKLFVASDLQYGCTVSRTNDVVSRGGGAAGSTQPRLTASDDAGLAFALRGAQWASMRLYALVLDDGPEQGLPAPLYPSSETYWGCTLGPCAVPGSGTPFEGGINERRGLAMRRFLLAVAPQVAESPLQYHTTRSDSASTRAACDQMQSVGWDMLVQSYGSGADIESQNAQYIAQVAGDVAYCRSKGVEVGMYDLIGWTRDPGRGWAALDAAGHDTGNACMSSGWGDWLGAQLLSFANQTGVSNVETDGPYAGYACSNSSHAHTVTNSVQLQSREMAKVYTALRNANYHINAPDSWFTSGINKMGVGYNEGTSRLPRREGSLIIRQVIYDATFYTQPAAAWSFLPLSGCGDPGCEYEPVTANLGDFEVALSAHLAYGVSAFLYQGDTLYDSPQAQALLSKWSAFFKAFRPLLATGDLVHVRRPSGQGIDAVMHAKAGAAVPGLVAIFNPTDFDVTNGTLVVPLYYTGIASPNALLTWEPWPAHSLSAAEAGPRRAVPPPLTAPLDWRRRVVVTGISVPARAMTWATVEPAA